LSSLSRYNHLEKISSEARRQSIVNMNLKAPISTQRFFIKARMLSEPHQ
jgi:hypothetical protein